MPLLGTLGRACTRAYSTMYDTFNADEDVSATVFGPVPQGYNGTVITVNHINHQSSHMSDSSVLDVHTFVVSAYSRSYVTAAEKCDLAFLTLSGLETTTAGFREIFFPESQSIEHEDEDGYRASLTVELHVRKDI